MPQFSSSQQRAVDGLARDLDSILGPRLISLVAYPGHQGDGSVHSSALVQDLTFRDLTACLPLTESWHHRGTSVPLLLSPEELRRTVDIFPLEYATMMADYVVVRGIDPFAGLSIPVEDIRRALHEKVEIASVSDCKANHLSERDVSDNLHCDRIQSGGQIEHPIKAALVRQRGAPLVGQRVDR